MLFLNCKDVLNSDRGFHVYCVCLFSIVCDVGYLLSLFKTLKIGSQFSQPISSSVVKATTAQNPDLTARASAVTSPNCWWLADFIKLTKFRLILFVTFKTPTLFWGWSLNFSVHSQASIVTSALSSVWWSLRIWSFFRHLRLALGQETREIMCVFNYSCLT